MKKIFLMFFCFLETVIILSFSFTLNAKSNYFFDVPNDNIGSFSLTNDSVGSENKFNVISPQSDVTELANNKSIIYAQNDIASDGWTSLVFRYNVICSEDIPVNTSIKCVLTYTNGSLSKLNVYLETDLKPHDLAIMSIKFVDKTPVVEYYYDCDFTNIYELYDAYFWITYEGFEASTKYNSLKYKECYKNFDLSFMYAMMFNPLVNGTAVTQVISDYDNPLLLDDIYNKIKVTDDSSTPKLVFLDGDYGEEGYYDLGEYYAVYIAIDDCGNVTRLRLQISVEDIRAPKITSEALTYSYTKLEEEASLEEKFTITDSNGIKETTFDFSNYLNNYNIVGEHEITVTSIDNYDNKRVYATKINVIDDVAPIITIPKNINSSVNSALSLDDIRAMIKINDTIDGEITDFTLIDNDDYANKAKGYSKYSFTVEASDKSGNLSSIDFVVKYNDGEFPTFDLSDLLFVLPNNEVVFKKDIEELLIDLGYAESSDKISISSDYFNNYNVDGNYPLEISINDVKYSSEIVVSRGKVSIGGIEAIEDSINYTPVIIGGISLSLIILISLMGIVIYKKRH